ncbi:hypothetical protein PGT21_027308 [Puccinia graminis f. sp. tritici]|uniref:t-SNARE coiled-coil homology domain-containing protein n=1 Tax=Puccinia graminis f. sp. tritici TaxID=56615 RepID=A0A5B0LHN4_PUCGR|nr:hypothetical protein PGTUg99_000340 [Puccinia graminis f. sp. tritici]KAA1086021.1 hypothetical protein PGT21_027308 [Puccinia graminis f. sp. tritici]
MPAKTPTEADCPARQSCGTRHYRRAHLVGEIYPKSLESCENKIDGVLENHSDRSNEPLESHQLQSSQLLFPQEFTVWQRWHALLLRFYMSRLPIPDGSHDHQIRFATSRISRQRDLFLHISLELEVKESLLDELDQELDFTSNGLTRINKRMENLFKKFSKDGACWTIVGLVAIQTKNSGSLKKNGCII